MDKDSSARFVSDLTPQQLGILLRSYEDQGLGYLFIRTKFPMEGSLISFVLCVNGVDTRHGVSLQVDGTWHCFTALQP